MHLNTQIESRLGGDPGTEMPLWSTRDHATPEYVRNVDSWLEDVDMTFHSVWQSRDDVNQRCATLITPDAFIANLHNGFWNTVGDTFRFIEADGTVHTREMTARLQVGATDFYIGKLLSDLPASVTPIKVIPGNFGDYFEGVPSEGTQVLNTVAANLNQHDEAVIRNLALVNWAFWLPGAHVIAPSYYKDTEIGDSSDPVFLIINGEAVLITTWFGTYWGPAIHLSLADIAAALVTVGSAHTVTIADLSKFKIY